MAPVYPSQSTAAARPRLRSLVAVFARDANLTFGGGNATTETLRREIVERRRWLTESDFRLAFAASRLTPGTNLLALCAAMGSRLGGVPGAIAALLAASLPTALITTTAMEGARHMARYELAADALRGAVAVSVALLVSSAWALVRPHAAPRTRARAALIVAAAWAGHEILGLSTLMMLLAAAAIGAAWTMDTTP